VLHQVDGLQDGGTVDERLAILAGNEEITLDRGVKVKDEAGTKRTDVGVYANTRSAGPVVVTSP